MAHEFSRTQRVADQLQRELAVLIQFEMKDPRVGMVTVSAVEVSRDLGYARVFVTVLQDNEPDAVVDSIKALNNAASFMRSQLARRMSLRTVPSLRFCYDESLKRGNYLSSLIDHARATDADQS